MIAATRPVVTEMTVEQTAATLRWLARLGREVGVTIHREPGGYVATDALDPSVRYPVTGFTCTCEVFVADQRCIHHAVLLDHLGWLPGTFRPTTQP